MNATPGAADLVRAMMELPPAVVGGRPNPEHYHAQIQLANMRCLASLRSGEPMPPSMKQFQDQVLAAAELAGIDRRNVLDRRTDAQVIAESVDRLLAGDADEACALKQGHIDLLLSAIRSRMEESVEGCDAVIRERMEAARRSGKAWLKRLTEARTLQRWAAEEEPPGTPADRRWAWKASHLLRFMVWVGRSNLTKITVAHESVFQVAAHHCVMAVDIWTAENGVRYGRSGPKLWTIPYTGVMLVAPPGHGKSEINAHWVVRRINNNHRTQGFLTHAASDQAQKLLGYVEACFDASTPQGRRNLAMFPATVEKSNTEEFRLKLDAPLKSPTLAACGVTAARSGANLDFLDLDDAVDQAEAMQETRRKATTLRIEGTLETRLRGGRPFDNFLFVACTLWHTDDANARRIARARRGEEKVLVSIQPAGGPPDFRSLWPGMYPSAFLRKKFTALGPHLYSAAYQCNPEAEADRIVRRVRLFDADAPEHERFLRSCVRRLSIDPSATADRKSDLSGIVYAGEGLVTWTEFDKEEGGDVSRSEMRVRVLDAFEIRATQTDVMEWSEQWIARCPTHFIHIETVAGFVGLSERFDERFGIETIRHNPRNRDKFTRLKACAPMLEDGLRHLGCRAIVEFPGRRNAEGELEPREDVAWLIHQVEKARMAPSLHALDALTQMLNWLAANGNLGIGSGGDTSPLIRAIEPRPDRRGRPENLLERDNERLRRLFGNTMTPRTADEEEQEWASR